MKRVRAAVFSFLFLAAFTSPPVSAQNCNFSCKEVPAADQVLYHVGKATRKSLKPGVNRMLIWNVYKGGKSRFQSVFADLIEFIRPDLVALEEATLDEKVLPAMNSLATFGWEMSANFLMRGGVPTGPALGSAVQAQKIRYDRTVDLEPFVLSPKTAVIAEYPIEGSEQTLLVVAIHGINFTNDAAFERQLTHVSAQFDQHRGPIIFAGDFNIRNHQRAQSALRIAAEHGLTRAPWVSEDNSIYYQLDDAYTRGVEILSAEVWSDEVKDVGSDHPALFLKFKLSK